MRNLKKRPLPPPPPAKPRFPWILFLAAIFSVWFVWDSLVPNLPKEDEPPCLYSNQCQQDIKNTLLTAVEAAGKSIHLVIFGLTDKTLLKALQEKIEEQKKVTVYYDPTGSLPISRILLGGEIFPIKNAGLMHQKIMVLDEKTIFIGSANLTKASLEMHDNLVIGFVSKPTAKFLIEHKPYTPGHFKTKVGGQSIEIWLLPDPRGHALGELRKHIRSAQKSIQIALFTLTHPALIEEVVEAHNRGVHVLVVVDLHSGIGASAKAIERLKKAGVPVLLSQGVQLLHHKFIYIDDKTLLTGSANWTKSAFYRNSDCIIALYDLNEAQKKFMKKLWRSIETASKEPL